MKKFSNIVGLHSWDSSDTLCKNAPFRLLQFGKLWELLSVMVRRVSERPKQLRFGKINSIE
jgi:hypothetical protein